MNGAARRQIHRDHGARARERHVVARNALSPYGEMTIEGATSGLGTSPDGLNVEVLVGTMRVVFAAQYIVEVAPWAGWISAKAPKTTNK